MVDTHAVGLAVLTVSVTLQLLTSISALRLVPLTSHRLPWTCLAGALFMMAVRRAIPLWHLLAAANRDKPVDLPTEGLALLISVVMFVGVSAIRPMFESMRRAEDAVRDSERRYRRLFEAHRGIGLLVEAETGRVLEANQPAVDYYGMSREALGERTVGSLSATPGTGALERFRSAAAVGGTYKDQHANARGEIREVEVSTHPSPGDSAADSVVHVLVSDVTERMAAEHTLREANEELHRWVTELERHRHDSEVHIELNALIQSCESVEEVGQVVGRLVPALFPDGSGALYLNDGTTGPLRCWARWGTDAPPARGFAADECWAFRRGQVHITEDPSSGLLCPHLFDGYEGFSLCLPIRAHGGTPGLITLRGSRRLKETTGQRQARLLADTIGLAVVNLRLRDTLRDQSTRDPLTGLFNRRYLEETLGRELARADRSADPVALLMVDLDHFKQVNDNFGHAAGDRVLQSVADLLRRHVRAGDVVCRYGGEEFAVVMPGASIELALDRAEALRRGAHAVELPGPGPTGGVLSLSVGVAAFPDHARQAADLVMCADEALYAAKRGGRDCVALPPRAPARLHAAL